MHGTRRSFFTAGGTGAAVLFLAACGDKEDEQAAKETGRTSPGPDANVADADIVNYALTLEYLEADFYKQVNATRQIKDRSTRELLKDIAQNEREHAEALQSLAMTLGGPEPARPETDFDAVIDGGRDRILETASALENTGAAAYLGQAANITDRNTLRAALGIHTVEGRHAAAINRLIGKTPTPDGAFAKPASMKEVKAAIQPFLRS
jgi:rubrerythrin